MAFTTPHQANDFPGDPFLHPIQHQPHNHALQNAWVSLRHRDIQMLIHQCLSFLSSRPLLPMTNLKAIRRTYLRQSGMLLGHKICITSTGPIKVSVTPIHLLPSLLLTNDTLVIEPCICIPQCRTRPRYPGTSTAQCSGGYQFMFSQIHL